MTPHLRLRQLAAAGAAVPLLALAAPAPAAHAAAARTCADPRVSVPVKLRLTGLHQRYVAGSRHWSAFRLRVRNTTAARCPLTTVLAYATRGGTLRKGSVQLEWRQHGHWVRVPTSVRQGVLLALAGPGRGLELKGHGKAQLPLRMRFPANAPKGEWVTLSVGFTPVRAADSGEPLPWPVGVSAPHPFRVVRGAHHAPGAERLAATGADPEVALETSAAAAAALASGTALLLRARRAQKGREELRDQPTTRGGPTA